MSNHSGEVQYIQLLRESGDRFMPGIVEVEMVHLCRATMLAIDRSGSS